jgi:clan AA aspartic protease
MIRGTVNARRRAVVRLRLRGPGGAECDVDAVVDSGFNGSMALPDAVVAALGLTPQNRSSAVLADGSVRQFDLCAAEVEWEGTWRPVMVSALGGKALLGMRLLAGHRLSVEVIPGGAVEITPLP